MRCLLRLGVRLVSRSTSHKILTAQMCPGEGHFAQVLGTRWEGCREVQERFGIDRTVGWGCPALLVESRSIWGGWNTVSTPLRIICMVGEKLEKKCQETGEFRASSTKIAR